MPPSVPALRSPRPDSNNPQVDLGVLDQSLRLGHARAGELGGRRSRGPVQAAAAGWAWLRGRQGPPLHHPSTQPPLHPHPATTRPTQAINEFTAPHWQAPDPSTGGPLGIDVLRFRGFPTEYWWCW